ncbi:transporter substrate-binding domain-containing protein [Streptomyces sp. NPDC002619]|uniref:transporter substrate-binding domain-containing protein n=1 Tax=Streptomyces sp. NPDC002619 TaxID=3364655 RepID=UPI003675EB60
MITSAALLLTGCGFGRRLVRGGRRRRGRQVRQDPHHGRGLRHPEGQGGRRTPLPPGTTHLTVAVAVGGTPPGTTYLDDGKTLTGQDVDFTKAVANVLGLRLTVEQAGFEAILPALDSGKYDFGVTDERRKTIDFVYDKILRKWGTTGSAIAKSQISPPELKN